MSARQPPGLSVLHGLTRAPSNAPLSRAQYNSDGDCYKDGQEDNIFLVFEYARYTLKDYCQEHLTGQDQDWDIIARRFEDLVQSIITIHDRDIVHRYVPPSYCSFMVAPIA